MSTTFDEWMNENDGISLRMERIYDDLVKNPNDPVYGSRYDLDLIVNGVNISETIKNLLGRLVV